MRVSLGLGLLGVLFLSLEGLEPLRGFHFCEVIRVFVFKVLRLRVSKGSCLRRGLCFGLWVSFGFGAWSLRGFLGLGFGVS